MTALLVILLILGILLLTPVGVRAEYAQEKFRLDVRIGWIRLHILPGKTEDVRGKRRKPVDKKKKPDRKPDEKPEEEKKKKPLSYYLQLVKMGLRAAKIFLKGIAIDSLGLRLTVGGTDASKTALLYGRMSAVSGVLHALLDNFCNLKRYDVCIGVDFYAEKIQAEGHAELSFLLYSVFGAAFCFLFAFSGMKLKEKLPVLHDGGNYERI